MEFDTTKFLDFVNTKWGTQSCTMCGQGPLSASEKIFHLTEYSDGALRLGGPVFPVIPVTCGNCGHSIFINAIIAGVIGSKEEPKEEKPEEKDNEFPDIADGATEQGTAS